jgi:hypothetical protein
MCPVLLDQINLKVIHNVTHTNTLAKKAIAVIIHRETDCSTTSSQFVLI